jgi:glycosyltransferase involved in cell wall biosynthesis
MKHINLLYLIGGLPVAGTPRHLFEVIRGLDRNRFHPKVCCFMKNGTLVDSIEAMNIEVFDLNTGTIKERRFLRQLLLLTDIIKKHEIQIVHTYLFTANFFGAIVSRIGKVPIVITSRRGMSHFEKKRHLLAYRISNFLVDGIIAVSDAVRLSTVTSEKVNPDKVITIRNGLNFSRFETRFSRNEKRQELGLSDSEVLIGSVGHLRPVKGYEFLIKAVPLVLRVNPNVRFIIAGEGSLRGHLQDLTCELDVSDSVSFLGFRDDVPALLQAMDFYVSPSLAEGISNSILEAMFSGKPIVATNIDSNREIIHDGLNGLLVEPASPQALADGILKVLKDRRMGLRIGSRAKEVA